MDLPRASTLARTNLRIDSPGRTLKVSDPEARRVADLLRTWLPAQRATWERQNLRPRVAILPLSDGRGRGLDELLGAAPESADTEGPVWQSLSRAGQATDEAELALAGFTRLGASGFVAPRSADAFVWGHVESRPVPGQVPFSNSIAVTAWIWDGRGAPESVTFGPFGAGSEAQAAAAVRAGLKQRLRLDPSPSSDPSKAAFPSGWMTQVLQQARMHGTGALDTPEAFRGWLRAVQMLEVVCFLDPADAQAREAWLRLRFSNGARDRAINPFLFKARAAAAWGQYVDRFGFAGSTNLNWTAHRFRPVVAQYFDWLDDSLEQPDSGQRPNDFSPTFYADWYARRAIELAARWMKARTEPGAGEFALLIRNRVVPSGFEASPVVGASQRFAAVADTFQRFPPRGVQRFHQDPPYPPAVQRLAADAGQPGAADAFLAAISVSTNWPPAARTAPRLPTENSLSRPANPTRDIPRAAPPVMAPGTTIPSFHPGPAIVGSNPVERVPNRAPSGTPPRQRDVTGGPATFRLPRIADLVGDQDRVLLDVREPDFSPPIHKVALDPIPFTQAQVEAVTQIVPGADGLWLVARGVESVAVATASPEASLDLRQPEQRFERLWWLLEGAPQPRRVSNLSGAHSVTAIAAEGRGVWAGLANGSVGWLAHPQAEAVWRTNGLHAGPVAALAVDDGNVLALGQGWWRWEASSWNRLPATPFGQELPATPGYGSWTRVGPDRVAGFARWARWDLSQFQWKPMPEIPLPLPAITAGTADGWLLAGGRHGLRGVHLERSETWSAFTRQALRILPGFGGDRRIGPNLQQIRSLQALLDRRATDWPLLAGRLPGPVSTLAQHGEFLWVGVSLWDETRRGTVLLFHIPSRRWVCRVQLPFPPACLSADGVHLWVGSSHDTGGGLEPPLTRLRIDSLFQIPETAWLSPNPEPSEVQLALAAMPARDRAVYELFRGNSGAMVEFLTAQPEYSWSAEDCFLRWLSADAPGRPPTPEASRWKTLLQERWPESSFTQALKPQERPGSSGPNTIRIHR